MYLYMYFYLYIHMYLHLQYTHTHMPSTLYEMLAFQVFQLFMIYRRDVEVACQSTREYQPLGDISDALGGLGGIGPDSMFM